MAVGRVELPPVDVGPFRWLEGSVVEVGDHDLLVRFAGTAGGPATLFMAHYDTVPGSPGRGGQRRLGRPPHRAGAGARRAAAGAPRPHCLHRRRGARTGRRPRAGARVLLASGPPIGLAVSLDMVGASRTALNGLSRLIGRAWLEWIAARIDESGADVEVPVPYRVVSRLAPAAERSDHGAFTERGVPAFHLYARGPERIYLPYHTAWDVPERLDAGAIDNAGRLVSALARAPGALPAAGGDPGFWLPGTRIILSGPRGARPRGRARRRDPLPPLVPLAERRRAIARPRDRSRRGHPDRPLPLAGSPTWSWRLPAAITRCRGRTSRRPRSVAAILVAAAGAGLAWLSPLGRLRLVGRRRFAGAGVAGAPLRRCRPPLGRGARAGLDAARLRRPLAAAALAPGRAVPLLLFALSLAPIAPALSPGFLRESAFHGFYLPGVPLPFFAGIILAPHAVAAAPLLARALPARACLPRWAAAVPAALLVAVAIAACVAFRRVPCDAASFAAARLACEIAPE